MVGLWVIFILFFVLINEQCFLNYLSGALSYAPKQTSKNKLRFVVFTHFHGVNILTMVYFVINLTSMNSLLGRDAPICLEHTTGAPVSFTNKRIFCIRRK